MPLIDLREPMKQTDAGSAFFAGDEGGARVLITVSAPVLAYYRDEVPPPDEESFRAVMVKVASGLYDAGPKDGYLILDMEALDLSA